MFLPEPVGVIASFCVIIIGDLISDAEKICQYSVAIKTMEANLQIVMDPASKLDGLQSNSQQAVTTFDTFSNGALKALGLANWTDVKEEETVQFAKDLGVLATATPATIEALAGQLSPSNKVAFLNIWQLHQELQKNLSAIS
jgi:hypothetical protein